MNLSRTAAAVCASVLSLGSAFGQARPATDSDATGAGGLQEIVVTAQRRSEPQERTPVTVAVVGAQELAQRGIVTEADLQSAVPGLLVRETTTSNQLNYAIRGQSIDAYTNSRPAVLSYFNEAQVNPGSASAFYDLQSVQVLKGPQGTLFGRNSTGGAVLFTTAQPTDKFEGYANIRSGNHNLVSVEGAVNIPVIDDELLLRLSGFGEYHDGYQQNIFDGSRPGTTQRSAGRISVLVRPTAHLSDSLVADFTHTGGSNMTAVLYSVYKPGFGNPLVPANVFFSPALDSVFGPGAWSTYLAAHPGVDPLGLAHFLGVQQANGPYTTDIDGPTSHRGSAAVLSNITTYDLNDSTQIKNIFGYSRSIARDSFDVDGSAYGIESSTPGGEQLDDTQYTDELQAIGTAFDGRLKYVAGIYYSNDSSPFRSILRIFDLLPFIPPTTNLDDAVTHFTSTAAYAQGNYDLSAMTGIQGLGFTLGFRETREKVVATQLPDSSLHGIPGAQDVLSKEFNQPSWQVGVQQQLDPDTLLYAVTRHSFRSGGFNTFSVPLPGPAAGAGALFNPERTTDVELGVKFQGSIGAVPTRFNADVYNQWVNDIQRVVYILNPITLGTSGVTVNVPKAQITGAEVELRLIPLPGFTVGTTASYTSGRFTQSHVVIFGQETNFGPLADTPAWSGSLFMELSRELPNRLGTFSIRADQYYQSKFYFSSLNSTLIPQSEVPGYSLANFSVGLDNIRGSGLSISASVHNAFDHVYYVGGVPQGNLLTLNIAMPGAPRVYYGEIRYKF